MLNIRLGNVFIVLLLLFLLTLTYGCSPNEETMKKAIINKFYSRDDMRNFKFTQFKMKLRYDKQVNDEKYYCAVVDNAYSIERMDINTGAWHKLDYETKSILYCFVKRGDLWDVREEGEER